MLKQLPSNYSAISLKHPLSYIEVVLLGIVSLGLTSSVSLFLCLLCVSQKMRSLDDDTEALDRKLSTGWNDKIVVLKKTTLQLDFKTFIEKINSANLIM